MNQGSALEGLEPISSLGPGRLLSSRRKQPELGACLSIDGSERRLPGIPLPRRGLKRWLGVLGPGLIACAAGNDAGGIATYAVCGAQTGYQLLWIMVLITFSLAIVQEMCSRIGSATGRGMLDLIRERFGLGWSMFAIAVVLIANGGLVVSEFVGIGAASELLGISKAISIPVAALGLWCVVVFGSYRYVEKIMLAMTLIFFAYPAAAVLGHPNPHDLMRGMLVPSVTFKEDSLALLVALIGTTITPYMQIFQQSSVVEKRVARSHYGPERADAYIGSILSNLMSIAIIVATAATLHVIGKTDIETAADAAKALEPVAGQAASSLFAIGLLGATLLAGAVLPLSTAYAISETFGFSRGINLDSRRAPLFFRFFSWLLLFGAGLALVPGIPVIKLLIGVQILNGVLLPAILVFILILANDSRIMGDMKNSRFYNISGWATMIITTAAVALLLVNQLMNAFGYHLVN